jgi:hypothetical protein
LRPGDFKTPEVADLYQNIEEWSHPEFPFLDRDYSPGSNVPAVDLTPAVAKWIQTGRVEAISELWDLTTYQGAASQRMLEMALAASPPTQIGVPMPAVCELRAIHLLSLRTSLVHQNFAIPVWVRLIASVLSCYPILISQSDSLQAEIQAATADGGFLSDIVGSAEAARQSMNFASLSFGEAQGAADKLRHASPMVRLVIHDFLYRGWGHGALRFHLYYDERLYGCGAEQNQMELEATGLFSGPSDDGYLSATITKEMLRSALETAGCEMKRSASRKEMVELARSRPGLVSSLISRADPAQRSLSKEWGPTVKEWAARIRSLEPLATFIVSSMNWQGVHHK